MRKRIFFAAIILVLACGFLRATTATLGYPCDGTNVNRPLQFTGEPYRGDDSAWDFNHDEYDPLTDCDDRVSRVVAIFDPSVSQGAADHTLLRATTRWGWENAPRGLFIIRCDGLIMPIITHDHDVVFLNPDVYNVPKWAFPYVIPETMTLSDGSAETQILSASGFLAVTIDIDALGVTTVTTYPSPLQ